MKKLMAILTAALLLLSFAACGKQPAADTTTTTTTAAPAEKTKINVCGIKGPTGVGFANLWKAQEDGTAQNDYTFSLVSVPADAGNRVVTGEADIAAVPTNLAAALYKKTGGKVQILAVNTLGVLHIMENGDTVKTIADLKGKTVYSTGEGANPEYILRYLLKANGLDPDKDVTLKFVAENDELATLMVSGKARIAMVPEPVATTIRVKNNTVRMALDVTAEWNKQDAGALMMGCVIVSREFAEKNPQAITAFLKEYETSLNTAKSDVDGTAALCEKYEIIPKAAVAKQAIPNCNLTFVAGEEMQKQITGYFKVLFDANPSSVGGTIPDDGFYYKK